jgi:hypothetical protein
MTPIFKAIRRKLRARSIAKFSKNSATSGRVKLQAIKKVSSRCASKAKPRKLTNPDSSPPRDLQFTQFKTKGLRPWLEQIANTLSNAKNVRFARVSPKFRENSFHISACASGTAHQSRKHRIQRPHQGLGLGLSQPAPPL